MRKLLAAFSIAVLAAVWFHSVRVESAPPAFVFPLSVSGKAIQTDIAFGPGFKPKPGKINDKIVGAILRGENTSDYSVQFTDVLGHDGSGRFYLGVGDRGVDGSIDMVVSTSPNGAVATTLSGAITQDGTFWIAGKYNVPGFGTVADAFATGKVKFVKGTFNPAKVSGTLNFVSAAIGEGFTLKFKTVGGPLA